FVVVTVGSDVAAAVLDAHFDLQLAAFADGGDVDRLVEHGKVSVFLDLRGGDGTGLFDIEINGLRQIGVELDRNLLQVEDDVGGVFDHAGDRREFVQNAFDFDGSNGRALNGAKERTTQRIAHGGAPTALKRLRGETRVLFGQRFQLGRETLRFLKAFPHNLF